MRFTKGEPAEMVPMTWWVQQRKTSDQIFDIVVVCANRGTHFLRHEPDLNGRVDRERFKCGCCDYVGPILLLDFVSKIEA